MKIKLKTLKEGYVADKNPVVTFCKFPDGSVMGVPIGLYSTHYEIGNPVILKFYYDKKGNIFFVVFIKSNNYKLEVTCDDDAGELKIIKMHEEKFLN